MSKIYGCVDLDKLTHIDFENGDGVWSVTREELLAWLEHKDAEDAAVLREKAAKWDRVKEIAESDYCIRCFNRFKCPSDDYAPCPFKDILEEVEEGGGTDE